MQKITPFLWYDGTAEQAMIHYLSVFKHSKTVHVARRDGKVVSATFQLDGQEFIAFNGGPGFAFTPAISLFVNCETQAEVDELWEKLSAGGEKGKCGWLKDKFGVSWQIIPVALGRLLSDKDPKKAAHAMAAMLKMTKIDIKELEQG
jgi:predicted 3-demethylubiquinone-9 3-methyltransferase (glyoxalase superfamily)